MHGGWRRGRGRPGREKRRRRRVALVALGRCGGGQTTAAAVDCCFWLLPSLPSSPPLSGRRLTKPCTSTANLPLRGAPPCRICVCLPLPHSRVRAAPRGANHAPLRSRRHHPVPPLRAGLLPRPRRCLRRGHFGSVETRPLRRGRCHCRPVHGHQHLRHPRE